MSCAKAGCIPRHYVGAEIPILGMNAHWDSRGEYFVAEGDESDGTIALFHPEHTLILNIEEEHLDFYADLDAIEKVFAQLINQTNGRVFYDRDSKSVRLGSRTMRECEFHTVSRKKQIIARDIELRDFASCCVCSAGTDYFGEAVLNVPGQHNVRMRWE